MSVVKRYGLLETRLSWAVSWVLPFGRQTRGQTARHRSRAGLRNIVSRGLDLWSRCASDWTISASIPSETLLTKTWSLTVARSTVPGDPRGVGDEGAGDVVAIEAKIEREVVPRPGGNADIGEPVLHRDLGNDRLRAVAACHPDRVGPPPRTASSASYARSSPASSSRIGSTPRWRAPLTRSNFLTFPPPDHGFMINTGRFGAGAGSPAAALLERLRVPFPERDRTRAAAAATETRSQRPREPRLATPARR